MDTKKDGNNSNGNTAVPTSVDDANERWTRPGTSAYELQELQSQLDAQKKASEASDSGSGARSAHQTDDADEMAPLALSTEGKKSRKGLFVGTVFGLLFLGMISAVLYFTALKPSPTAVNTPVRDQRESGEAAGNAQKAMTADAIADAQRALNEAVPQATASPQTDNSALAGSSVPSTGNYSGDVSAVTSTPATTTPAPAPAIETARNTRQADYAIRWGSLGKEATTLDDATSPSRIADRAAVMTGTDKVPAAGGQLQPSNKTLQPSTAVVPPLGTMLPVRTLGALHTIRNTTLVRLQLTREMRGPGWTLDSGTVLIGSLNGSDQMSPRAFVSLVGYIDPQTHRFVTLPGEVMGADGGQGLMGKRRMIGSGWSRAFARIGIGAVGVAETALNGFGRGGVRGNGSTVIIAGGNGTERIIHPMTDELNMLLSDNRGRQSFVEVPAGTSGYVMITNLPAAITGVDATEETLASNPRLTGTQPFTTALSGSTTTLTDQEVAELLTNGTIQDIRSAWPRMSPEMRRAALVMLAEPTK